MSRKENQAKEKLAEQESQDQEVQQEALAEQVAEQAAVQEAVEDEVSGDNEHQKQESDSDESAAELKGVVVVAEGKSIVTLGGIKVGGDEVEPRHFAGGDETVAELIEKGYLENI